MDISGVKVDSIIKVEKLNPTLKVGNNSENLSVEGNLTVNNVYTGTASPVNPDLMAQKVLEITSNKTPTPAVSNIEIAIAPFMGIVMSPEKPGTRIHLEFAVTNKNAMPSVINGAYVKLGVSAAHFKKFFKVNENSSREPDFTTRFPIIINANGATRLAIEFENVEESLINLGDLRGTLFVLVGNEYATSREFVLDVNEAMINTLKSLEEISEKDKAPFIFDAMLKS